MGKNIFILIYDFNIKNEIEELDKLIILCIKRIIFYFSFNNIFFLDIKFRIINVYFFSGLVMGGIRVTVIGEGFFINIIGTKVKVG